MAISKTLQNFYEYLRGVYANKRQGSGRLWHEECCSDVFDLGKLPVVCREGGFEPLGGGQGVTVGQGEVGMP